MAIKSLYIPNATFNDDSHETYNIIGSGEDKTFIIPEKIHSGDKQVQFFYTTKVETTDAT